MLDLLRSIWSNWRIGLAATAALAASAGLLSAWLTPRGPITATQTLTTMVVALAVGLVAGLVMGNRWSLLVAPIVFVVVFELARLGVNGPTVDAIHLNSAYGIIAFVLGRGFHAVVALLPMLLGATYGVWLASLMNKTPVASMGVVGWIVIGLVTVGMVALAVAFARPGFTSPIVGPDGDPLPGSVAEITTVPLGGHEQTVMIRGRSADNPVLLYLAGGPGGADLGAMRADVGADKLHPLEQHFVVATWEQRGAGKSYAALEPVETLTPEQMVRDTVELTNYLRERFGEEKIYLMGNSWGTLLGVLVVEQHPELFHAYIGTGQMVSPRETDRMFYEDTMAWAEETGNAALIAALQQNGPPPYDDLLAYEPAISHEHDWNPYPELDMSKEMPNNLFVPENSLIDRINGLRSFLETFSVLYPQIQDIDFREDVPSLEVPVYIVLGQHEARGRAVLAKAWFEMLAAPSKELIIFEHSGHRPSFEEPTAFVDVMNRVVEATYR
ncbi:MAG: alpha/beta fold hydrolase [Chloroflexi bacterium]|jgi:pimeloyl-ACP methyl ester carboxylesterase|nr:alpha/beta fold hydrolase [Chloroflexota bacterium]